MNYPLELRESDINRCLGVMNGELEPEWISDEELKAFEDRMFDVIAHKTQTHEGSLVIQ